MLKSRADPPENEVPFRAAGMWPGYGHPRRSAAGRGAVGSER